MKKKGENRKIYLLNISKYANIVEFIIIQLLCFLVLLMMIRRKKKRERENFLLTE
jgi:large-conductance mechanosensitive channel